MEQLGASPDGVPDIYTFLIHMELKSLESMSKPELLNTPKKNVTIGPAIQAVQQQKWPQDMTIHGSLT